MSTVARNVRNLRAERQLSIEDLAKRSGLSKGGVWTIEQGKRSPNMGSLEKLAKALSVSVSDLISEQEVESR